VRHPRRRLPTYEGDVRDFDPAEFIGVPGFIASPVPDLLPRWEGRWAEDPDFVLIGIKRLEARQSVDTSTFTDEQIALVLEPLRRLFAVLDLGFPAQWVAFEQVATVLPVWEAVAAVLRRECYSVAPGFLFAEEFGVPPDPRPRGPSWRSAPVAPPRFRRRPTASS
jgi:DNA (cytosine-5)-methyltransferase 1